MKTARLWITGLTVSLGAHAALFAFLAYATEPKPLIADPVQSGKIKMTSYEVPQSKVATQDSKGEAMDAREAHGQALGQGPVRSYAAAAQPLSQSAQAPQAPLSERPSAVIPENTAIAEIRNKSVVEASGAKGAPTPALRAEGAQAKATRPPAEAVSSTAPPPATPATTAIGTALSASISAQNTQAAIAPSSQRLAPRTAPAAQAATPPLPTMQLASARLTPPVQSATAPNAGPVFASSLVTESSAQISADGTATIAKAPPAQATPSRAPNAPAAVRAPLATTTISAATGWSGQTTFNPASLAAIQSFVQPLDASQRAGGTPRDAISQLLASVPCARLAATFIPETGTLELRGHIPDASVRAPLLTAISQQLGGSIPVGGSMIVLPSPQCDVLSRLENLGLPQSTKQAKDPKELGAITQLATFDYSDGEQIIIKMKSYDFPAYVYVDFFDVDGNVLHLRPNIWEPLQYYQPGANITVGDTSNNQTAVKFIARPPFGRELVVAYASSVPLYDGLREITEPADTYLAYLRGRIAALKTGNPDYKGDWVYMFVETHE